MNYFPPYIALVGAPNSGKSTAQKILAGEFGFAPVDNAAILREAGMVLYGLTEAQVSTQEGKCETVQVMEEKKIVRDLLGGIGLLLRELHGEGFMYERAIDRARQAGIDGNIVFDSVRRDGAKSIVDLNGLCVEIVRPGIDVQNDFDDYDKSLVDVTILNDGDPDAFAEKLRSLGRILQAGGGPEKGTVI